MAERWRYPLRMPHPDRAAVRAFAEAFEGATGERVEPEAFCFGDSPAMADELAALVMSGRKRATGGGVQAHEHDGEELPRPGQHWVLYDGSGQPVCVARSDEVSVGPLNETLDPAFAWDEGEGDRTYEDWLSGHAAYWRRTLPEIGAEFDPGMPVVLVRFSVVWPDQDQTQVLTARGSLRVRHAWTQDRAWLTETIRERWGGCVVSRGELQHPGRLPALIAVDDAGHRVGVLTFRPRPGGETEVVTVDALESSAGVGGLLLDAAVAVGRREGWRRLWLITTNDNTVALRAYQRAGWNLVAVHRDAVTAARDLKSSIPRCGLDGIPMRHELELELPLGGGS